MSGNVWWRLPRSGNGNGGVATVTPSGSHRPSRCRDDDCPQLLCRGYKLGYEDGYGAGYGAGEAADNGASEDDHDRRAVRRLFRRWFLSTERRYAMFQTIVGGTIANLIAAGIIAGIAVAAGVLHISASWSWSLYAILLVGIGAVGLPGLALDVRSGYRRIQDGRLHGTKREYLLEAIRLYILLYLITIPIILTLLFSLDISINHGPH